MSSYKAEYNNNFPKKRKGTGVAFYVNDNYTYTRLESLCHCTANIECLFIKVTNLDKPYTIGVVYGPPNGSETVCDRKSGSGSGRFFQIRFRSGSGQIPTGSTGFD